MNPATVPESDRYPVSDNGPYAYAQSLLYLGNAERIASYTRREYGTAPTTATIQSWLDHKTWQVERVEGFAKSTLNSYDPANDDGAPWRPRGLVKYKPAPKPEEPKSELVLEKAPTEPYRFKPGVVTNEIVRVVCERFKIEPSLLKSKCRRKPIVAVRALCIELMLDRKWSDGRPRFTSTQIADALGKERSTINHAHKEFPNYCKLFPAIAQAWEELRAR